MSTLLGVEVVVEWYEQDDVIFHRDSIKERINVETRASEVRPVQVSRSGSDGVFCSDATLETRVVVVKIKGMEPYLLLSDLTVSVGAAAAGAACGPCGSLITAVMGVEKLTRQDIKTAGSAKTYKVDAGKETVFAGFPGHYAELALTMLPDGDMLVGEGGATKMFDVRPGGADWSQGSFRLTGNTAYAETYPGATRPAATYLNISPAGCAFACKNLGGQGSGTCKAFNYILSAGLDSEKAIWSCEVYREVADASCLRPAAITRAEVVNYYADLNNVNAPGYARCK